MKVGTDAILLGSWATADDPQSILDVGTGSGVIALMLAQRFPAANIQAVEIDPTACQQAQENFAVSLWSNRIRALCCAVQKFESAERFDLIVCNPPYFNSGMQSPDLARDVARRDGTLTFGELVTSVQRCLRPGGRFAVVLPTDRADEFCCRAEEVNLFCCQKCLVRPTENANPRRQLLEFSNERPLCSIELQDMFLEHSRHAYSNDYRTLAKEFLLKL